MTGVQTCALPILPDGVGLDEYGHAGVDDVPQWVPICGSEPVFVQAEM